MGAHRQRHVVGERFLHRDRAGELRPQALGLLFLKYSRDAENQADELGVEYAAKAGYDPAAAVPFWERMGKAAGGSGSSLAAFLRTHPTDEKRRRQIQEWLPDIKEKYYKPRE